MRLINTTTYEFADLIGRNLPPYATLSHTWEDEEVTYQDWFDPSKNKKKGFRNIEQTCRLAARKGIEYAWVDSCCIDKSSSAEIEEAINSMFLWYKRAAVCYVYLSDLPPSANINTELRKCRWFTRGWTLQELVAPGEVEFYNRDWVRVGTKTGMIGLLRDITGINDGVLRGDVPLAAVSVAERMTWAAGRTTTRIEDGAYCLLGIFNVNMPMLYGEEEKAFRRLQEEIIKRNCDLSIFAWVAKRKSPSFVDLDGRVFSGILAESPEDFVVDKRHKRPQLLWDSNTPRSEFSVTNAGIKLACRLAFNSAPGTSGSNYILPVNYESHGQLVFSGVRLKKVDQGHFVREDPFSLDTGRYNRERFTNNTYILTDLPPTNPRSLILRPPNARSIKLQLLPNMSVANAWPWTQWDDEENTFYFDQGVTRGSFLIDVRLPIRGSQPPQHSTMQCMFLVCTDPKSEFTTDSPCTVVDYQKYQPTLDSINCRIDLERLTPHRMHDALKSKVPQVTGASFPLPESGLSAVVSFALEPIVSRDYGFAKDLKAAFSLKWCNLGREPIFESGNWYDMSHEIESESLVKARGVDCTAMVLHRPPDDAPAAPETHPSPGKGKRGKRGKRGDRKSSTRKNTYPLEADPVEVI